MVEPEGRTQVTYTRHPGFVSRSCFLRRPSEGSGLGFACSAAQRRSRARVQKEEAYSQRHLMAINNIENKIGGGVEKGGRPATGAETRKQSEFQC